MTDNVLLPLVYCDREFGSGNEGQGSVCDM